MIVEVRASAQTDLRDIPMITLRQVSAASRTTESIEDAPASVSIITAQELEAFAYPTILEALRGTRGMSPTFDSIYGNVAVRGLGQPNDYTNRLLVLSDGMTLNENVLYQPFLHYDGRTDLGDVDRIESRPRPGLGAVRHRRRVSGVINLVMRGSDEPTSVQGGISSYDNAVARGRIAVTYRNKDYGIWTSLAASHSDGRQVDLQVRRRSGRYTRPTRTGSTASTRSTPRRRPARRGGRTSRCSGSTPRASIHIPTGSFGSILNRTETSHFDRRGLVELKFEPKFGEDHGAADARRTPTTTSSTSTTCSTSTGASATPFKQPYQETYPTYWSGAEARIRFPIGPGYQALRRQ